MNARRIGRHSILVFLVAICVVWSQVSVAAANDWDETSHDWDQMVEADGNDGIKVSADEKWGRQAAPAETPPASQINNVDDSIRLSNSADASAEAHTYAEDDKCDGHTMHTVMLPDGTESKPFVCAHITRKGGGNNAVPAPTTREILYYAATTIHADGAGLHKRPEGVSYTNKYIPTLVAATHPTQTHTVTLLGHDITVTLTATSYTWSWGGWDPGPHHDLAGDALARGHGPQHRPRAHSPLLQGSQRVEVLPGRPLPLRHAHHYAHHDVGGHGHQPLHGRHPDH